MTHSKPTKKEKAMYTLTEQQSFTQSSSALCEGLNLKNILCIANNFKRRSNTRGALSTLSPSQLKDVGLRADQAAIESRQPFWK
jgi:uncharacterized protein YjiS (DUF1127 family)